MENGYTSAEDVRRDEYEPITTKATGRTYAIRRLWPRDLATSGLLSILTADFQAIAVKQEKAEPLDEYETQQLNVFVNALLCLGVSSINVVDKPLDGCKGDEVSVHALRLDRVELSDAILAKAGWAETDAHRSVVSPAGAGESFRREESPDSGDREAVARPVAN